MNPASKSYNPTLSPRKARKTKFNTVLVGDKQITEESSASGNEVCLEESVSPPRKRTAKPHHNGQTETMTSVAKFISLVNGRKNNNTEKAGLLSSTVPKGKTLQPHLIV